MTNISIPDLALQFVNKTLSSSDENTSSYTIFLVGNKSAGKTTLLHSFLDKTDQTRETLVLEYSFGRKTVQKQGIDKNVCHVWEYGGSLNLLQSVLMSIPAVRQCTIFIVLDLSNIKNIWATLETCIKDVKEAMKDSARFPNLVIVGGKYDIFKNYDTEMKKVVCTTLRAVAQIYNCDLFFYSSSEPALVKRAKEIFHGTGFGAGFPSKDRMANNNKPLYIPKGSDSWDSIGIATSTFEQIKSRHLSQIPQGLAETAPLRSNGPTTAHAEPVLDKLIAAKYDELRHLLPYEV